MKTRDAIIEYQKTLDDAGTLVKDLDLVDPVSAIALEFQSTNGSTSNKGNYLSDVITKIEIVDGSEVLYSVSQSQLEALHFYKTGKTPALFPSEWASGAQRHACLLLFGRHLWDQEFAFDCQRFKNPQIKITTNIAAITAASATTAIVSGSLKGTIVAKVMEEGPRPSKYLMAKEIESFTSATSGEKRIELPTDKVYRMLMGRFWVQLSDIDEIITDLKLTCDSDKFIPINRKVQQLDAEALALFGRSRLKHDILTSHQTAFRLLHNKEPELQVFLATALLYDIVGINYAWSSEGKLELASHAGAADSTDRKFTMVEEGHALHATLPIPFGIMSNPDTWFDPLSYKKVELVLTQAVAASCQIVLEQVRPLV